MSAILQLDSAWLHSRRINSSQGYGKRGFRTLEIVPDERTTTGAVARCYWRHGWMDHGNKRTTFRQAEVENQSFSQSFNWFI